MQQGAKCKFSHDLTIGARKTRLDLHCDLREVREEEEESKKSGACVKVHVIPWFSPSPPSPCTWCVFALLCLCVTDPF